MINRHMDDFMGSFPLEGLTFDDVSLVTCYADFLPADAEISSRLSRRINLNIPFISAAMDTVTESKMAIAMATLGGIGVIHKNLEIERQADEVRKVKSYLHGLIEDPVCFYQDQTISHIMNMKKKMKYTFSGFPIVERNGKLAGIITARDIKFLTDYNVKIRDVMSKKTIVSPEHTTLDQAFKIMVKNKVGKLPITNSKGILIGLYSFHDVKELIENTTPIYNRDKEHRLRVAAAIGPYDEARAEALIKNRVDVIVIDTAHGHSKGVIETVRMIKKRYGDKVDIIAGNIATGEAAKALADAGADAVKVGIGPGSICTTRVVTGVGIPQLTAIYNVIKALGTEIPIIADGGIKQSGDVAKAISIGASTVMMGSGLAGTNESPGEKTWHQGRMYVVYRGMGSLEAMKKGKGSRERYGQAEVDTENQLVPQGIEGLVLFRGEVKDVIHQYAGGLRYALGYCGARNISEFQKKAQFVRITGAGLREAHPHDVKILKEAPNYYAE
ncbi:MAG: IMP dehydrogenase [Victivallales bacterium]